MRLFLICWTLFSITANVKSQYWQQSVDYTISVSLDEKTSNYSGKQKLIYKNNSPETLHKVFYHLYFNAFQPGSEMAVQLKNSPDKNTRFDVDLDSITKDQQGFLKVDNLTQDGVLVKTVDSETCLLYTSPSPRD